MHQCKKIIMLLIISIVTVLLETTTVFAAEAGVKERTAVESVLATKITERNLTSRSDKNRVAEKKLTVFQKSVEVAENVELVEAMENMEPMEVVEPIVVEEPVEIAETKENEELEFSAEDITNLTCLVFAESGNQEPEGQIAVAAVVINRKRNDNEFSDAETIDEVIFAEYAFASITKVDFVEAKEKGCYDAVMEAVNEEDPTEELLWAEAIRLGLDPEVYAEGGALYFYNPDYCSEQALQDRANIKCKIEIGDHIFYKVWDK